MMARKDTITEEEMRRVLASFCPVSQDELRAPTVSELAELQRKSLVPFKNRAEEVKKHQDRDGDLWLCTICGKKTKDLTNLQNHLSQHIGITGTIVKFNLRDKKKK